MKLIGLSINGLRKIKAAELDFDGKHLVQIRGENGAGKSTIIDSILYLFKGSKTIPAGVVTHGHDKGTIVGRVDGYTIRRVIDATGKSTLTVEGAEGKVASPQGFLDAIAGQFLDPEWFNGLPSAEKRKVVMKYAGIDFSEIDTKIAVAEQNRLVIGRELKGLGAIPPEPEKAEEVSVSALLAELNKLNEHNTEQAGITRRKVQAFQDMIRAMKDALDRQDTMEEVNSAIAEALPELFREATLEMESIGTPSFHDTSNIEAKIANAESINAKARAYAAYLEKIKAVEAKKAEYDAADAEVAALRKQKDDMVANAKLPMPDLTITDTGLAYKGTTDENWSDSEGMKIAIRLAVAYSGDLKAVYIKRGEAMDSRSLARLKEYAEKEDFQVIVEIVDDSYAKSGDDVLYIEDGVIVPARKENEE